MATGRAKVFVNYRRADTAGHAGRLYDSLQNRVGRGSVLIDMEVPPGVDYVEWIDEEIRGCDTILVVIGPSWLAPGADGDRRIDRPNDFLRLEIESALRNDLQVIPVLVDGAVMPSSRDLPATLAKLARVNAIELHDRRWSDDVNLLYREILEHVQADRGDRFLPPTKLKRLAPVGPRVIAALRDPASLLLLVVSVAVGIWRNSDLLVVLGAVSYLGLVTVSTFSQRHALAVAQGPPRSEGST